MPKEVFYLRLKDSASSFKQDSCATRFTLQNPYDILLFDTISLYTFELKSTDGTSFSFQRENDKSSKMIKFHQIKGLLNANEYANVYSGFVFDFRKSETYFLRISNFRSRKKLKILRILSKVKEKNFQIRKDFQKSEKSPPYHCCTGYHQRSQELDTRSEKQRINTVSLCSRLTSLLRSEALLCDVSHNLILFNLT